MTINIRRHIMIDRIHMAVGIGSKDLFGFVYAQLLGMRDMQATLIPGGKIMISKVAYRTRLGYYPHKKHNKIADIEIGTTKSKHRYFRLGLYPTKFRPGDFDRFKEVLGLLLPDFNYEKLFVSAQVTYIELASDSLSQPAHTFVPFRDRCNKSCIYVDPKSGEKGTTYLGSKLSALRYRIYDKRRQQLEMGQSANYDLHTRIEAVRRHVGLTASDLSALPNAFQNLEIADLHSARQLSTEKGWQTFLDRCMEVGSAGALKEQSKNRKQYKEMLRMAKAWWWNPIKVWLSLPRALNAIAP